MPRLYYFICPIGLCSLRSSVISITVAQTQCGLRNKIPTLHAPGGCNYHQVRLYCLNRYKNGVK